MPLPLRDYQLADLTFHLSRPRSLNLSDPGTGKTPTVCAYAAHQWQTYGHKTIWVMPKSLLAKNAQELLRFTAFSEEDVIILDGPAKRRAALMASGPGKVFLIGFDCLRNEWQSLLRAQPRINCLLIDELHMAYSSNGSRRTQELFLLMRRIRYFIGMTGTLIKGRLDAAYPALHIIARQSYPTYNAFRCRHVEFEDDYGNVLIWKNLKRLKAVIDRVSVRHSFAEVHGPEAKVTQIEVVAMGAKMRDAYDVFHEQAMLALEDRFLDGAVPAVAVIRARQIMAHPETFGLCRGEVSAKDRRLSLHLENAKVRGDAVIIYAALVPEQRRIRDFVGRAGIKVGLINGSVSAAKRARIDEDFRSGRVQVLVASPQTASIGFNWGHAAQVIFASMDYQDTNFLQAYRRAMRGVRRIPLLITVLQYEHSVDQRIYEILQQKSELAHRMDETQVKLELKR